MTYLVTVLLAGGLGGFLRGCVGYIKYYTKYKNTPFKWRHFLGMTLVSALIGFLTAWVSEDIGIVLFGSEKISPAIAFIIGYAGGDFIENIFKITGLSKTLKKLTGD